jgi:ABC-2 type transport system ATP-binding protein
MIEVSNLTKTYGSTTAIGDLSFTAQRGEVLGFLGPNGAGKTTTMRILSGFLAPTSGSARVAGFDVVENSLAARRHTGYLPENVPLYPEMTVESYLSYVAVIKRLPRNQRRPRVAAAIEQCGLKGNERTITKKLSKGFRQRVGLAQALLHDPEVLILDEPTVGLDPRQIIEVRQLIKSLAGTHTIILSTHILPEVEQICDRVVILSRGRVIAEDTPDSLSQRLRGVPALRLRLRGASAEDLAVLQSVPGVRSLRVSGDRDGIQLVDVEGERSAEIAEPLARAVVERGLGLRELTPYGMSLEDVFLELTTREEDGGATG